MYDEHVDLIVELQHEIRDLRHDLEKARATRNVMLRRNQRVNVFLEERGLIDDWRVWLRANRKDT